jgi:hypothetical protein
LTHLSMSLLLPKSKQRHILGMAMPGSEHIYEERVTRKGGEYEQFVYEKFKRLFVGGVVTPNDKIMGHESGLEREIDISVRFTVEDQEVLYIVQCKDRATRPADMVVLGEFSAVIRDVGAGKGFLICTSGFAKSNHQYARTLGIELFTVEDINSDRWKADVQIPFVYVKKQTRYHLKVEVIANQALVEKNRDQPLTINFGASTFMSLDRGRSSITIQQHIENTLKDTATAVQDGQELDLLQPGLQVQIAGVWVDCSKLTAALWVGRRLYLKYLTPDEYSHIRDHLNETVLPLHATISGVFPVLDDSFVEVSGGEVPVQPGLFVQAEEWTELERAQGIAPPGA